jgi:D-alanyl-D-alanine carboxypeptidase/D-alanyl-D-alanine-endopeptidase (penicillin-binding protein 4)
VAIVNDALTARGRPASRFGIERAEPLAPIRVHGEMAPTAADAWRRMTVQDPVLFAAHALTRALHDAGITVDGGPDTVAGAARSPLGPARIFQAGSAGDPRVLAEHVSPPLLDYLAVINQESHNLFADLVLRTLGRIVEGEGSYDAGVRVVERYLTDEVGVAAGSVRLVDGSGLAADNRASPASFVALIGHLARTPEWASFRETLPEAGSRQLRRMQRTMAAGNLRAKTGTIRGVSALSGVVRTHDGDHIAFSIVGNELPSAWGAKRLEDRIAVRLAGLTRSPSTSAVEPASAVGAARERDGSRRRP